MSSSILGAVKKLLRITTALANRVDKRELFKPELLKPEAITSCLECFNMVSKINRHPNRFYHTSTNVSTNKHNALKQLNNSSGINVISGSFLKEPNTFLYRSEEQINECDLEFRTKPQGTHLQSGAIKHKPATNRHGFFRAIFLIFIFVCLGGRISSLGAHLLHEYEIFALPEDDEFYFD